MGKIKGIPIVLIDKKVTGKDPFGVKTTEEVEVTVENVLVAPASSEDVTNSLSLTGKKIVYSLAIPKGDTHNWVDREVRFFGRQFRTVGIPQEGIESMIPLEWNKKVMVERYE